MKNGELKQSYFYGCFFYALNRKEIFIYGLCDSAKGPYQNKEQGLIQLNKEAAHLLHPGGAYRSAAFLFPEREPGEQHGDIVHDPCHAPVLPVRHV